MCENVMVLGGGIAGLSAAFYLSQQGVKVILVEKSCFLGGIAIGFDCKATDKCQQCGACMVEEMLRDVVNSSSIDIYLNTEIEGIKREQKGFNVKLKKSMKTPLPHRKALKGFSKYNYPLQVAGEKLASLSSDVVKLEELGVDGNVVVDAIILATGFTPFDPTLKPIYNYGVPENVITGLDLERMLREKCAVIRPSDGKVAKKIAFVQCVGSRNREFNHEWCSEVCCTYALRIASALKYKDPDSEIWVFYIDTQNVGKDYLRFSEDIKTKVNFINAVPIDMKTDKSTKLVKVAYNHPEGGRKEEEFDIVVLSVGITPNEDNKELAKIAGVDIGEDGFLKPISMSRPATTNVEGIFLAGTVTGPKTILDTISHAKSAVGETLIYLRRS